MAYFTPGSLIHCGTNAAIWRVTQINPDGSIEVVYVSGKKRPKGGKLRKRIERPEKYKALPRRLGDAEGLVPPGDSRVDLRVARRGRK